MGLIKRDMGVAFAVVFCLIAYQCKAQLRARFYRNSCPQAELVVKSEILRALKDDVGVAAGLVKMHFHNCWVPGCEGSVFLDSTPTNQAEEDSSINNLSLRGFEVIDDAKARLEAACSGVVSCADILTFAARDSIALVNQRLEGLDMKSLLEEGMEDVSGFRDLHRLTSSLLQPRSAHSRGLPKMKWSHSVVHMLLVSLNFSSFSNWLNNFNSTLSQAPSQDATYAAQLKQQCFRGITDNSLIVSMDPPSPAMDRGLFTSDQTLLSYPSTASQVRGNANNGKVWRRNFAQAMVKMSQVGVLTGRNREIRRNCRVVN